jgi:hypothetical protein
LKIKGFHGDASDNFKYHDGMAFSTYDKDHDNATQNCAEDFTGSLSKSSSQNWVLKSKFSKVSSQKRVLKIEFSKASSQKWVPKSEFLKLSSQKRVLKSEFSKATSQNDPEALSSVPKVLYSRSTVYIFKCKVRQRKEEESILVLLLILYSTADTGRYNINDIKTYHYITFSMIYRTWLL